jgi:hypothetical protein
MIVFFRYIITAIIILCVVSSCSKVSQKHFSIQIDASAFPNSEVELEELDINKIAVIAKGTTDSLGNIKFEGVYNESHLCRLRLGDSKYIYLMMDARAISVKILSSDLLDVDIKGSPRTSQLQQFMLGLAQLNKSIRINTLTAQKYITPSVDTTANNNLEDGKKQIFKYISNQMDTVTSLPLALLYANFLDVSQYPLYLRNFTQSLAARFPLQQATVEKYTQYFLATYNKYVLDRRITNDSLTFLNVRNTTLQDFTIPDFEGTLVNTAHFTDKYIVMQFLSAENEASRNANKHLNNAYQQLKDYPVQFLSIYIESDSTQWVNAAISDNLPWPQLSSLKSWNCPVVNSLQVITVPTVLVIDNQHRIVAANWTLQEIVENIKANTQKIIKIDTLTPVANNN